MHEDHDEMRYEFWVHAGSHSVFGDKTLHEGVKICADGLLDAFAHGAQFGAAAGCSPDFQGKSCIAGAFALDEFAAHGFE